MSISVIFTKLGYEVEWDNETKTIDAKKTAPDMEEIWIVLQIDLPMVVVNDVAIEMDVAPFVQDGRTFVPLRFVAEMDGCEVDWDPETRTVIVNTAAAEMTEEQETPEEQPEEEMAEETPEDGNTAEE